MPVRLICVLVSCLLICACIGCAGDEPSATPAAQTPVPTKTIREQIAELRDRGQPPGKDAWPLIEEAARRSERVHDELASEQSATAGEVDPPEPDYSRITDDTFRESDDVTLELEALRRLEREGVFDLLAEIAECPRAVRPIPDTGALLLADPGPWRGYLQVVRASLTSGKLALRAGDEDLFVKRVDQTLALGRLISHDPLGMGPLTGTAFWEGATEQVRQALREDRLSEASCVRLLAIIDGPRPAPILDWFEANRLITLDFIDQACTLDDSGDGQIDVGKLRAVLPGGGVGGSGSVPGVLAGRKEMIEKVEEYFGPAIEAAKMPTHERESVHEHENEFSVNLTDRHVLLKTILPVLARALVSAEKAELLTSGTQTMLALEIHRIPHGEYPDSLDELMPEIVAELPPDPHSGKSFCYRLLEDDPHGRGYLLYSVGTDGIDHGGQYPSFDAWRALQDWPAAECDFVVNLPPWPRDDE